MQLHAASFGVSPSRIDNSSLLPGISYTEELVISTDVNDQDTSYYVTLTGDAEQFIDLGIEEDSQIIIEAGQQSKTLELDISIPSDSDTGDYSGMLVVERVESFKEQYDKEQEAVGDNQSSILPAVIVSIDLKVQHQSVLDYAITNIATQTTAVDDPIPVFYDLQNMGNQPARPSRVVVNVTDFRETKTFFSTEETVDHEYVDPFGYELFFTPIKHALEPGTYWLHVAVLDDQMELEETRTLSLEIVEEVVQEEKGSFTEIGFTEAQTEDAVTVDISAVFKNESSEYIPLIFTVELRDQNGETLSVEEMPYAARGGATIPMNHSISISEAGRYTVAAEVTYPGGFTVSGEYKVRLSQLEALQLAGKSITEHSWFLPTILGLAALFILIIAGAVFVNTRKPHKDVTKPKTVDPKTKQKQSVSGVQKPKKEEGKTITEKKGSVEKKETKKISNKKDASK